MRHRATNGAKTIALLLVLAMLAACTSTERFGGGQPDQTVAATPPPPPVAPPPPPPQPPPVSLSGKWKLSVTGGGACLMTLGANTGAAEGTVAPAGGCPGSFFTSRKWSFEGNTLNLRDHKGGTLAQLSFADGGFSGKATDGGAVTLARAK